MRDLRYGIEIEMTGLSRGKAAETLAGFFGTRAEHTGGSYDAYAVRDAQGRVWKLVSDGSIQTQKKVRGQTVAADSTYSVELVSPVCVYEDIGTMSTVRRALDDLVNTGYIQKQPRWRANGAKSSNIYIL